MNHDIEPNSVDLIYLDPPFFTGKVQKGTAKWNPAAMEVSYDDSKKFWGEAEKVKAMRERAPEWMRHIAVERPDFASYLYYMMERLQACHKVLKNTGSIYLHCDWRASHYLKMAMDEIFGYDNFLNEIAWCFYGGGQSKLLFPRKHHAILYYHKGSKWTFNHNDIRVPYDSEYKGTSFVDKNSRAPGKSYKPNPKGKVPEDFWIISRPYGKDVVGYPTQKPTDLLKRIINASCPEGGVVLDPFCGCGTTIIAAQQTNHNWIGIDKSKDAYEVSVGRYHQLGLTDKGYTEYQPPQYISRDLSEVVTLNPHDFERWVNEYYKATKPSPDKGVDGVTHDGIPIQTKTFEVSRKWVDEFNSSIKYHPAVKQPATKGIIVSSVGFDESAKKRQYEIKYNDKVDIEFKTPAELLKL